MAEEKTVRYTYTFVFPNGEKKEFVISLDAQTLSFIHGGDIAKPEWTKLSFYPCEHCPLDATHEYCPVAVSLSRLVSEFGDSTSYDRTTVVVECAERMYTKETTIQKGLSGIIGLYMATSGCPIMDKLRPMTRFHLPFATTMETLYRAVSAYLTAQYFLMKEGKYPDWEMAHLVEIYKSISNVNKGISLRLSKASQKDANVNAVVILHSFGDAVPYFIENGLDEIKHVFSTLTRADLPKSPSEIKY